MDAAEEEAADELHDSKRQERVSGMPGIMESRRLFSMASEEAAYRWPGVPETARPWPRDAAERDEAGDEDDVQHGEQMELNRETGVQDR